MAAAPVEATAGAVEGVQLVWADGVATTVCTRLKGPVKATIAAIRATTSGNQPAQMMREREMILSEIAAKVVVLGPLRSSRRAL